MQGSKPKLLGSEKKVKVVLISDRSCQLMNNIQHMQLYFT